MLLFSDIKRQGDQDQIEGLRDQEIHYNNHQNVSATPVLQQNRLLAERYFPLLKKKKKSEMKEIGL